MRFPFLIAAMLAGAANAETITLPPLTHVKIDALHYPAGTLAITAADCGIIAPGVGATACHRANNAAQQTSPAVMLVNAGYFPIYIDPAQDLLIENGVLFIASRTGDIVCNGAVPPPATNGVFANGFE